jgi:hypothetical protein
MKVLFRNIRNWLSRVNKGNNKRDCDSSNDSDDMVLMKKTLTLLGRALDQSS